MTNSSINVRTRKAALALLAKRPMCLPGTRAILLPAEAKTWHDEVTAKIQELKLKPAQVQTFCDVAGVAD